MSQDDDLEAADIWGGGTSSSAPETNNNEEKAEEKEEEDDILDDETRSMSITELRQRIHLLDNDIRVMRSDVQRIAHESRGQRERIRENMEKVKQNKQLPYLVGNVVEVLEPDSEDGTLISQSPFTYPYSFGTLFILLTISCIFLFMLFFLL